MSNVILRPKKYQLSLFLKENKDNRFNNCYTTDQSSAKNFRLHNLHSVIERKYDRGMLFFLSIWNRSYICSFHVERTKSEKYLHSRTTYGLSWYTFIQKWTRNKILIWFILKNEKLSSRHARLFEACALFDAYCRHLHTESAGYLPHPFINDSPVIELFIRVKSRNFIAQSRESWPKYCTVYCKTLTKQYCVKKRNWKHSGRSLETYNKM